VGRKFVVRSSSLSVLLIILHSIQRNTQAARELSESTGRTVVALQADVREPMQLQDAVAKTIETFGRIDFVICGISINSFASVHGM
jgi:2,4-dienoyl-CoA reductase [(3E)-enoyl-CoA-producing], peroxisomal